MDPYLTGVLQARSNPYTGAYDPSWAAAFQGLPGWMQQQVSQRYQGWNPQNIMADWQGGYGQLQNMMGGPNPAGTTQPLPQGPPQTPQTLQEAQGGNLQAAQAGGQQQPYVPGGILGGGTYYTGGPLNNPQIGAGGPSGTAPQIGSSMGVTPTGQGVSLPTPGMWGGAAGPGAMLGQAGGQSPNLGILNMIQSLFQGGQFPTPQMPQMPQQGNQGNLGLMHLMQAPQAPRPAGQQGNPNGMAPPPNLFNRLS